MPDDVFNVLMVGVGGQGIVLASDILAEAALLAGFDVKKSEIHGMSQRGGPVFSHVRFGTHVDSPVISTGSAHVLYALERMELLRWADYAGPDAVAVYFAQDVLPAGVEEYPDDLDDEIDRRFDSVVRLGARALRGRASPKVKNVALLGAVSAFVPLPDAAYAEAMAALVPEGTVEANRAGFALGRELAEAAHVE